jgi:hypothetical protein
MVLPDVAKADDTQTHVGHGIEFSKELGADEAKVDAQRLRARRGPKALRMQENLTLRSYERNILHQNRLGNCRSFQAGKVTERFTIQSEVDLRDIKEDQAISC